MQTTPSQEITTSMTKRSQVTVPAAVRRVLKLRAHDSVTFAIRGNQVQLEPAKFTVDSAFGSVKPVTRTDELEQISQTAKQSKAERTLEELRTDV